MKPRDILMEIFITVIIASGLISVMSLFVHLCNKDIQQTIEPSTHVQRMYETASYSESTERDVIINDKSGGKSVTYTALEVPYIDSSFKTWMSWTAWDKNSSQYKFYKNNAYIDKNGFARCYADSEFGIPEDYYLIALGSYYGTSIGTKYRITLDTGNIFYGILGEFKADKHTNSTNQYAVRNNDIIEFIVDDSALIAQVRSMGSASAYLPLSGRITSMERIDLVEGNCNKEWGGNNEIN